MSVTPHSKAYAPEISWEPEVEAYLEAALGGPAAMRRISAALARPPLATCLRVNTLRTTPEVRAGWLTAKATAWGSCQTGTQPHGLPPLSQHPLQEAKCMLVASSCTICPPTLPLPPCRPQELLRRLPAALTPEDAALLDANPPYVHPLLPDAIILPGTGPHTIEYSRAGEGRGQQAPRRGVAQASTGGATGRLFGLLRPSARGTAARNAAGRRCAKLDAARPQFLR